MRTRIENDNTLQARAHGTRMGRMLGRIATVALLGLCPWAASSAPPPWQAAPYTYQAENQPLRLALEEFARHFGLRAQVTPDVEGLVNGRIGAPTPTEFMDRLSNMFGLIWFHYGGTIYVTRSTNRVTRSLALPSTEAGTLKKAMEDLGLYEPRFGWAELPDRGAALVSGPPEYVELVAKVLAALPAVPSDQEVTVFKLKNAPVDDRTVRLRDRTITTPGVATILRNLVSGNGAQSSGTQTLLLEMAAPLRGMGGAGFSAAGTVGSAASEGANSGSKANSTSGGRNQPVIQSDPRQNAIIVRDLRERIPIYEKLIAFLDQPTALIEIEALIVDVNDTKVDELGVDWLAGRDGRSVGFGTPMTLEPDRSMLQVTRNVNPVTLVIDSGNFLIGKIKVLESTGDARLLSRPSILTLDNMGATIDLSTTFYVRVVGERVAEVVPVTASTTLRVTPRYVEKNGKRLIQLVIDIEDGSLQDSEQIGQLPTVVRSSVNTEAVVGENQSLLIGGYKIDSDISQNDGLPLISKIPIVGAFFRHARKETQRRERLFLITPKIIALATEVAPATVLSLPPERPNPAAPWKN